MIFVGVPEILHYVLDDKYEGTFIVYGMSQN